MTKIDESITKEVLISNEKVTLLSLLVNNKNHIIPFT